MKLRDESESGARFEKYVDALASVIGHADRIGPLHDYCTGLILPGDRKSVEPLAAKTDPSRMAAHHQYCGQLGKQANCQVAVTLSIANHHASLPVAYRLYLPKDWAEDDVRRKKAHIPATVGFKTKPQIALEQLRWACEAALARGAVMMDPAYGNDARLRTGITALGLLYVAGIQSN